MKSIIDWLNNEPNQRMGIRVCQVLIGCSFVFRAATELQYADYLYSSQGIVDDIEPYYGKTLAGVIEFFLFMPYASHFSLLILGICGVFYIVNYRTLLTTFISLFLFNVLVRRNASIGDGGDNLTQLILTYMLFLIPYGKEFKPKSLRVWFHNLGVTAIGLQVMIMYFTAGFV